MVQSDRSAEAEPSLPVIDEAVLSALQHELSDEMMPHVVDAFRRELDQQLGAVARALGANQFQLAGRHAHTLKGTAATVGARALWATARAMEHSGECGDADALRGQWPLLERKAAEVIDALQRRYPNGPSASPMRC